ncbi:MAG: hypothetical protein ABIF85_04275 [Nanoarchaeota archaeon]|nr:hypothetical protein [Nanoarchaeota archaeon]MBU4300617.1 hypothetical protein [Nanoarchaeota archaeon]MBU4452170.1 hypothetical protein [Nanoarchaeota archaeon]MCG2724210.1 hypothetical protein [archaeon]
MEELYDIKPTDLTLLYGTIGVMQRELFPYIGRVKSSCRADTKTRYFFRTNKFQETSNEHVGHVLENFLKALEMVETELY